MTGLQKFGGKIYFLLVENFPQTYYVGGAVRDALLGRKTLDLDIATSATPQQVADLLSKNKINFDNSHSKFGVTIAKQGIINIEIATFRKEIYSSSRYPKITYVAKPRLDAARRDFTVNALYLRAKNNKILDYYGGGKDLKKRLIKFIGSPAKKVFEDPLRIVRALRFCLMLNFKLEARTRLAIKNNFRLIKALTKTKTEKEIVKLKNKKQSQILRKVINSPGALDKYF